MPRHQHKEHIGIMALNALFPPQCMACSGLVKSHGTLCSECWGTLHFITDPMCAYCGFPFEYDLGEGALCASCIEEPPLFDSAYSAFRFDDTSRSLLHKLKFEDQGQLAHIFADWLARHMPQTEANVILPVPLSRKRLFQRRYNQSALVAAELAKNLDITYWPHALQRVKHTLPQTGLTREQRLQNVRGAFRLRSGAEKQMVGKHVLLLDDVMTTGATLDACTKVLQKSGASSVHIVTLARVV